MATNLYDELLRHLHSGSPKEDVETALNQGVAQLLKNPHSAEMA